MYKFWLFIELYLRIKFKIFWWFLEHFGAIWQCMASDNSAANVCVVKIGLVFFSSSPVTGTAFSVKSERNKNPSKIHQNGFDNQTWVSGLGQMWVQLLASRSFRFSKFTWRYPRRFCKWERTSLYCEIFWRRWLVCFFKIYYYSYTEIVIFYTERACLLWSLGRREMKDNNFIVL